MSFKFLREDDEQRTGIVEIQPTPTFIDPVSKIRVSQPENLIDTDFEYGLQETKWETLERVNNIPTFFARPGDQPINVDTITGTVGSSRIVVNSVRDHGLVVGSPIIAQGVDAFEAEGAFIVDNVASPTEFSYVCKDIIFRTGFSEGALINLKKQETVILVGQLYQGTQAKLDVLESITTDGQDPSTLTVTTPTAHGFAPGTKFILSNSVGGKTFKFDAEEINPNDFELLETAPSNVYKNHKKAITSADWDGTYNVLFTAKDIDYDRNVINCGPHPFRTGDAVMYMPPPHTFSRPGTNHNDQATDRHIDGVGFYNTIFYVVVVDENNIQLSFTEMFPNFTGAPSIVNMTSQGRTETGFHQIAKCYQIESVRTDGLITLRKPLVELDEIDGQEAYVFSTSSGIFPTEVIRSFANYTAQDQLPRQWFKFYIKQDDTAATTNLPVSKDYGLLRVTSSGINTTLNRLTIQTGVDSTLTSDSTPSKLRVSTSTLSNFQTGDEVRVWKRFGDVIPAGIGEGTLYWIRIIDNQTFSLHTSRPGAIDNTGLINITNTGSANVQLLIEKQNRYIKLYNDENLTNLRSLTSTSVSGTTWIVLGTTNPDFSTLTDGQDYEGEDPNIFSEINSGDVVQVQVEEKYEEDDVEDSNWPLNSYTDFVTTPRPYVRFSDSLISIASGSMSEVTTTGTPFKYVVRPATFVLNNRSITIASNIWGVSDGVQNWTRGLNTGDKVRWSISRSPVAFNARNIDTANNRIITFSGYFDLVNGDEVELVTSGDQVTLPIGLQRDTTYYVRQITTNQITLHTSRAGAVNNFDIVPINGHGGMGIVNLVQSLPPGEIPFGVEPECDEDEFFVRLFNFSQLALYKRREDAIADSNRYNFTTFQGGYTKFEQVLEGTEGYYWRTNTFIKVDQNSQTFNTSTNVVDTIEPHGFHTGEEVRYLSRTFVTGLAQNTNRWLRVLSPTTFTLHNSRANAFANLGITVLSGTPEGEAKFTRIYGDDFDQNSQFFDFNNNTVQLQFDSPYENGDNVYYLNLSGGVGNLPSTVQFFVRNLNDNRIAFYETREEALFDVNRRNLTSASGFGSLQKVEQLSQNKVYYHRYINNSSFFIYPEPQDAIFDVNRIFIVNQPALASPRPPLTEFGSGYVVWSTVTPWNRINSVNNFSANYWNTNANSHLRTGQQVRLVRMYNEPMNQALDEEKTYFIRRINNSIIALHRTYAGAMRDIPGDRVNIFEGTAGFHIEGLPLPVGLSAGASYFVQKVGPNSVRFIEDAVNGRTIRIAPTLGSRFGAISLERRTPLSDSNTFNVPGHGLVENTPLIYNSGPSPIISASPALENNVTYFVSTPTENRFRISTDSEVDTKTIRMTGISADTAAYFFQDPDLGLTRSFTQNSSFVFLSPNVIRTSVPHGFSTGDAVVYSTDSPATPEILGLEKGKRYFVRLIAPVTTDLALYNTKADAEADTNRVNVQNHPGGIGFLSRDNYATGDAVSVSTSTPIAGIQSGAVYYVGVLNPERFALFYTREEAEGVVVNLPGEPPSDLRAPILSFSVDTVVTLNRKGFVRLLETGVGIQELNNVAQNAVDGIYTLDVKFGGDSSTVFSLSPTDAILSPRLLTLNPYEDFSSQYNAFYFADHKLYTGAEITYNESVEIQFDQDSDTVDDINNVFIIPSHGLTTGQEVRYALSEGGREIGDLEDLTSYFANAIDVDTFSLHATKSDAELDVSRLSLSLSEFNGEGDGEFDGEFDGEDFVDAGPARIFGESALLPISGLSNNTSYYVIRLSKDWFRLAQSKQASILGDAIPVGGDPSLGDDLGSEENHSFTTFNVGAEVVGPGTVSTTLSSNVIDGESGTNFLNLFKNGDIFKIFITQPFDDIVVSQTSSATNRQISFTQNTSTVNTSTNIITTPVHGYLTGDYVRYNATNPAGGLENDTFYFVRLTQTTTINATTFTLHNTKADAFNNENIVNLTSSSDGTATFTQANQFFLVNHEISDGQTLIYNSETPMSGLQEGRAYYASPVTTIREYDITSVNTTTNVFSGSGGHGFVNGDDVVVSGSDLPEGLIPGQTYFVRFIDAGAFALHDTRDDAIFDRSRVNVTTAGSGVRRTTQSTRSNAFRLYNTFSEAQAALGTYDENEVALTDTTGNAELTARFTGSVFESKVLGVRSATGIVLEDSIPAIAADGRTPIGTQSEFQYALVTSLFVKADGFALHRPFDGGVELTPSLNPDSSLVRQTRKYFRYQSGKGIQVSYGINFNAPKAIDEYVIDRNTGIARIKTRFPNRVTDSLVVTISEAEDNELGSTRTFTHAQSNVDDDAIVISAQQRQFVRGQSVRYVPSGAPLGGLSTDEVYWLSPSSEANAYRLHTSFQDALEGLNAIEIESFVAENVDQLVPQDGLNGTFQVVGVIDDITFNVQLTSMPATTFAEGFAQFVPASWSGSLLRCGIFDDQNGLFFEFDGQELHAVRRSSVEQIAGAASVAFNSNVISGQNTLFQSQLSVGDRIVIKGQTYKIVDISSNTSLSVQPAYRGATNNNVIITKTIDTRTPQSQWNLDKADGNGPSGFELDITKMQMAYIDYSWYGAGKARFGFKARTGDVLYFHEYVHNNLFTEAYMRSGNLPARYEVLNLESPTYSPTIAHWGTSIIMDGRFDNDDSYLFTASGETISFTNTAEQQSFQGRVETTNAAFNTTIDGVFTPVYFVNAANFGAVRNIRPGTSISGAGLQPGTATLFQPQQIGANRARVYIDKQPTVVSGSDSTYLYGPPADSIPEQFPLVSIRLGPAVDNSLTGPIGTREIINRMQLELKDIGILTTHDVEVKMILNGNTDNLNFDNIGNPSLSQIIRHQKGDTITGGVEVYSFRVSGASTETTSTSSSTVINLDDIVELGNSIQGGDGIYPDGPDLLTISATVVDTGLITAATPLRVSGRISWSEAQA